MVLFDNRRLRGRIVEKFGSQTAFAKAMGLSERSISLKINGNRDFSSAEIAKMVKLLKIDEHDIADYFFKEKVQMIEQGSG